jgi:DNA-binding CsgD family transcriptional regulator
VRVQKVVMLMSQGIPPKQIASKLSVTVWCIYKIIYRYAGSSKGTPSP